ncbi:MAG: serine/threonine-protein kinase, partial [Pseudomonadota bacterium]
RPFFYGLETTAYDYGMRLSFAQPSEDIAIITIDEKSIQNIGRWPWSRGILANLLDRLHESNAKVIASTVFVSEEQLDPGLAYIRNALDVVDRPTIKGATVDQTDLSKDLDELRVLLQSAEQELNSDQLLQKSIVQAENVILPLDLRFGKPIGRPDDSLPDYVSRFVLENNQGSSSFIQSTEITPPIPSLGAAAHGIGHLKVQPDIDGAQRQELLVIDYFGQLLPSLALMVAAKSQNLSIEDISLLPNATGLQMGGLRILTTPDLEMYNYFYRDRAGRPAISMDSFYDVWTGNIPADKYRNKIVLIGASASGVGDTFPTPTSAAMPPVQILAHTISSILQEHFFTRPTWASQVEIGFVAAFVLYLVLIMPRLRSSRAAVVTLVLLVIALFTQFLIMLDQSVWIRLVVPCIFLVCGHLVMTVKRFGLTERMKIYSDMESAESNRMLGLAFQGQGQLDMAFEKFRKCPLDDSLMDVLYNLALDYERKRQFNKAGAVYGYMADHNLDYKDLKDRVKRTQNLEETVVLGRAGGSRKDPLLVEGDIEKPMLGRYQVSKEIGRGAMSVVYEGLDPKINRKVAIKTIMLSAEFEDDELEAAKERFFREAETAGRLNHPDIVTIFDAGEEDDLAYIAMEFLTGEHLNGHTRKDNLLPPETVLSIMARAAEALGYAHEKNVVHRDIKPANIMYEGASDVVKVTDFGIARVTDASKTKTGIVLGTPSYMSPEQLSGQRVDGRSDLFSLGVTIYQLLTGELPFKADSLGGLMFKITSEAPAPLSSARPELPDCVEETILQLLEKEREDRIQSGAEVAQRIRDCMSSLVG